MTNMNGTKYAAWKAIIMALRNLVRDTDTAPGLPVLMAYQENLLLTVVQVIKYVLNRQDPHGLPVVAAALVAFLLAKTKGKPQRYTVMALLEMQRTCLPTKAQVWAGVIVWWRLHHKIRKGILQWLKK